MNRIIRGLLLTLALAFAQFSTGQSAATQAAAPRVSNRRAPIRPAV
jgi:hypothetical protein